jgi:hypothetical protein
VRSDRVHPSWHRLKFAPCRVRSPDMHFECPFMSSPRHAACQVARRAVQQAELLNLRSEWWPIDAGRSASARCLGCRRSGRRVRALDQRSRLAFVCAHRLRAPCRVCRSQRRCCCHWRWVLRAAGMPRRPAAMPACASAIGPSTAVRAGRHGATAGCERPVSVWKAVETCGDCCGKGSARGVRGDKIFYCSFGEISSS